MPSQSGSGRRRYGGTWNDSPNVAGYGSKRPLNQDKTNHQALSTHSPGLTRLGGRTVASSVTPGSAVLTQASRRLDLSMRVSVMLRAPGR